MAAEVEEEEPAGKRSPKQRTQVNGPCLLFMLVIFVSKAFRLPFVVLLFDPTTKLLINDQQISARAASMRW